MINHSDLVFINNLSKLKFKNHSFSSVCDDKEKSHFEEVKKKLRHLASHFSLIFNDSFGPFKLAVSPYSNPITRGNTLNGVWSAIYKGNKNKQYAAQISFVIDKNTPALYVGYYFGSASSHDKDVNKKEADLKDLRLLGQQLAKFIESNELMNGQFYSLFDIGFVAHSDYKPISPDSWLNVIKTQPENACITVKIKFEENQNADIQLIEMYASQLIFLMSAFDSNDKKNKQIKLITASQFIKRALRLAEIGLKGEEYILKTEKERLTSLGIKNSEYPVHVALISPSYGYDILSIDEEGVEIYIEVKSTSRIKEDPAAKSFFMTSNEYKRYEMDKDKYKIYRVYNTDLNPSFEVIDMESIMKRADGYIVFYE